MQCGAANAAFHALDLSDIGARFGDFDYIIAHGVYAWTPDPVRTALMPSSASASGLGGSPSSASTRSPRPSGRPFATCW